MALPNGVLEAVRDYLDITWTETENQDKKLTGIIERGMKYIDGIAGRVQDYTIAGKAQGLLYNYCRYERANAMEDFQRNYLHELVSLQLAEGVAMIAEAEAAADV